MSAIVEGISSKASELLTATEALRESVIANGGYIHQNVEFRSVQDGIGIFAKADISKTDRDTFALSIPYSTCISKDLIIRNASLAPIFTEMPGLLDYQDEVLCIGLMYAKCNPTVTTDWSLHVLTLPAEFNTTLYWSVEELNELQGCNIFHLTNMLKKQLYRDWESIFTEAILPSFGHLFPGISFDLYCWAMSIVYSRAIGITRNGKYIRCITPCLDMANHSLSAGKEASDTIIYHPQKDEISLVVTRNYPSNEEIFVVYGEYSNAKLAHTYGFVLPHPSVITIDLWSIVSATTNLGTEKKAILSSHELTQNQTYDFYGTIRSTTTTAADESETTILTIASALLVSIRVIQLTEEELSLAERAYDPSIRMISTRNELATYTSLKQLCVLKLKAERAEADREELGRLLLDGAPLSNRKVIALKIRTEERELLSQAIAKIDEYIDQLTVLSEAYIPPDVVAI